jgi:hypothetical protein
MLAGNIYVGHDSVPSPEYRRDLEARHGALGKAGDPLDVFAKVDALAEAIGDISARINAVSRSIDVLKASAHVSDQIGRPENMSPSEWLERKVAP